MSSEKDRFEILSQISLRSLSFIRSASHLIKLQAVNQTWKQSAWKDRRVLDIDRCKDEKYVIELVKRVHTSLQDLSLRGSFQLSSKELIDLISKCTTLTSMTIDLSPWSPRPTWEFIQSFVTTVTSLCSLRLSVPGRFEFTDEWNYQTNLTSLFLWVSNSKFRDFNWLSRMTKLCKLTLRVSYHPELDTFGSVISPLTNLTSLSLEAASLKGLNPNVASNIKELALFEPKAEDTLPYLSEFNSLRSLTVLNVYGPSLDLWSAISTLTSLQRLYVQGNNGEDFRMASTLVNLTHLELVSPSKMTAEDFAVISNFTSLRYLKIDHNTILTDSVLTALAGLTSLTSVNFEGCRFTKDTVLRSIPETADISMTGYYRWRHFIYYTRLI